ncbi:Protein phosphatase 2C-like protein 1 [Diplonema papillatum]|nr:Protein phosphatase 2C-like protein 1 [Diplonema papillatum]KAJ9460955.1 Protein phosphatase 2C-like protein 1 [Diplonema papillatum]
MPPNPKRRKVEGETTGLFGIELERRTTRESTPAGKSWAASSAKDDATKPTRSYSELFGVSGASAAAAAPEAVSHGPLPAVHVVGAATAFRRTHHCVVYHGSASEQGVRSSQEDTHDWVRFSYTLSGPESPGDLFATRLSPGRSSGQNVSPPGSASPGDTAMRLLGRTSEQKAGPPASAVSSSDTAMRLSEQKVGPSASAFSQGDPAVRLHGQSGQSGDDGPPAQQTTYRGHMFLMCDGHGGPRVPGIVKERLLSELVARLGVRVETGGADAAALAGGTLSLTSSHPSISQASTRPNEADPDAAGLADRTLPLTSSHPSIPSQASTRPNESGSDTAGLADGALPLPSSAIPYPSIPGSDTPMPDAAASAGGTLPPPSPTAPYPPPIPGLASTRPSESDPSKPDGTLAPPSPTAPHPSIPGLAPGPPRAPAPASNTGGESTAPCPSTADVEMPGGPTGDGSVEGGEWAAVDTACEVPAVVREATCHRALAEAFEAVDRAIYHEFKGRDRGGAVCAVLIVTELPGSSPNEKNLRATAANLGDCRIVLHTQHDETGKAKACRTLGSRGTLQLTRDHKASLPDEAARVRRCGGIVIQGLEHKGRVVYGDRVGAAGTRTAVQVTRAFGDFCLKGKERVLTAPLGSLPVSNTPEVASFRVTDSCRYAVLATDGLWDVVSNDEAARVVSAAAHRGPMEAARGLAKLALEKATRDNVTATVVFFSADGWSPPETVDPGVPPKPAHPPGTPQPPQHTPSTIRAVCVRQPGEGVSEDRPMKPNPTAPAGGPWTAAATSSTTEAVRPSGGDVSADRPETATDAAFKPTDPTPAPLTTPKNEESKTVGSGGVSASASRLHRKGTDGAAHPPAMATDAAFQPTDPASTAPKNEESKTVGSGGESAPASRLNRKGTNGAAHPPGGTASEGSPAEPTARWPRAFLAAAQAPKARVRVTEDCSSASTVSEFEFSQCLHPDLERHVAGMVREKLAVGSNFPDRQSFFAAFSSRREGRGNLGSPASLFVLCDGLWGKEAAEYASHWIPYHVYFSLMEALYDSEGNETVLGGLSEGRVDRLKTPVVKRRLACAFETVERGLLQGLRENNAPQGCGSGCSAVVLLAVGDRLFSGAIGSARAVLLRVEAPAAITHRTVTGKPHVPASQRDAIWLRPGSHEHQYPVTRCLGLPLFKTRHTQQTALDPRRVPADTPDVFAYPLASSSDGSASAFQVSVLVVGNAALWSAFSDSAVAEYLLTRTVPQVHTALGSHAFPNMDTEQERSRVSAATMAAGVDLSALPPPYAFPPSLKNLERAARDLCREAVSRAAGNACCAIIPCTAFE